MAGHFRLSSYSLLALCATSFAVTSQSCHAQFGGGLPKLPGLGGGDGKKGDGIADAGALAQQFGFSVPGMQGGPFEKLAALWKFESKSSDALLATMKEAVAAALKAQGVTMEVKTIEDLSKGVDKLSATSQEDLKKLSEAEKKNRDEALSKLYPAVFVGEKMVAALPVTFKAAGEAVKKASVADAPAIASFKDAPTEGPKMLDNVTKAIGMGGKLIGTMNNAGIKKPDSKEITKQANKMLKDSGAGGEIKDA